jgi:ferritin-like metal-binding protein YciE
MTITLSLQPQEEAKLKAIAHAKGLSADALVREALEGILAGASEISANASSEPSTGALLIAAMQASPHKEMDLEADRALLPTRDIVF